ncbi:MAG: metallophosphoesterase [Gemmatimonadota bacterium]
MPPSNDSLRLSRRQFAATAAGILGAAVGVDACVYEPSNIEVTTHEVLVPGLPRELDGVRIAQISDVHLYQDRPTGAAAAVARWVAEARPEIVVLTGDICERRSLLPVLTSFARDVRGTAATLATIGNWERWGDIANAELRRAYDAAGVEFLFNETATVRIGGATLDVVGLDDPRSGHPDLAAASGRGGSGGVSIWLVHAPGWVDTVPRGTVPVPAMILAGHTHGGQVRFPGVPPLLLPKMSGRFVEGWYRDTLAPLYVSRGVGTSVLRARFNCPPEVPVFTMRSAAA